MARSLGSRWETDLPLFRREAVGCYNWGLVNGRMQCQFSWSSKRGAPEPAVWFHDLYHGDGRPYDPQEIAAIGKTTADTRIDFSAADYTRPQPDPGEVTDTDRRVNYSAGWTAWAGEGPRYGTLHYHNEAGGRADITFEGTGVYLVYKVGPDCGLAELLVDGQPATKPQGGELDPRRVRCRRPGHLRCDRGLGSSRPGGSEPRAGYPCAVGTCHGAEESRLVQLLRTDRGSRPRAVVGAGDIGTVDVTSILFHSRR